MSNEYALSQYQKRVDDDDYESMFIEMYYIEQSEELVADIQSMLKAKGYSKDIIEFFDDICAYDGLDAIITEHAQEAYRCRFERDGD